MKISFEEFKRQIPTIEETIRIMYTHYKNRGHGILMDYDFLLESRAQAYLNSMHKLYELKKLAGVNFKDKNQVANWIKYNEDIAPYLPKTDKGAPSLNANRIKEEIEKGNIPSGIVPVLNVYLEYATEETYITNTESYLLDCHLMRVPTNKGNRMARFMPESDFILAPQVTNRIGYQLKAFQNFDSRYRDLIFTAPVGYTHYGFDSSQVDPRLAFSSEIYDIPAMKKLIPLYNDAYFAAVYLCEELDLTEFNRTDFTEADKMPITPELEDKRKQLKAHLNGVTYNKTTNELSDPILRKLIQKVGRHPSRLEFMEKVHNKIKRGDYIITNMFGEKIDVSKGKKGSEHTHHLVNAMVADYIQSTAAALNRYNVVKTILWLEDNTEYSTIQLNIHDSLHLNIHKSEIDAFQEIKDEICAYDIEGWIPIGANCEIEEHGTL